MKNLSHKSKKLRQQLIQVGLLVALVVMGVGLVVGHQGLIQMWKIKHLRVGYQDEIARLTQEIARGNHERALLAKSGYLERVVRREMGYIENGETIFLLPEFP